VVEKKDLQRAMITTKLILIRLTRTWYTEEETLWGPMEVVVLPVLSTTKKK